MTDYSYDPDNWLVSASRSIQTWVQDQLTAIVSLDSDVKVEMSFPDTSSWTKMTPLDKILVHFELDHAPDTVLGFGQPGVEDYNEVDGTWQLNEATMHELNFDVGVWVSAEMGGASKRMETIQALKNLLTSVYGIRQFNEDTEGLNIVSFSGGRNVVDRINDVPVWRGFDMTLVVRVFGRHIPAEAVQVPLGMGQSEHLTVLSSDGTDKPL